jgi:hypothetical protein
MKRTIITMTAVLAVLGLAILLGAPKGQNFNSSAAIAAPAPVPAAVPMPNRCPNIHEAIGQLEAAEGTLRDARHDFCGHKHEAMEAVHHAIEQLRQAEGCAKCRD